MSTLSAAYIHKISVDSGARSKRTFSRATDLSKMYCIKDTIGGFYTIFANTH